MASAQAMIIRDGFDSASYLRALRGIATDVSYPVTREAVQRKIVAAACERRPESLEELKKVYLEVLRSIGARYVPASEKKGFLEQVDPSKLNIPWFDTRWFVHPKKDTRKSDYLRVVADILLASGFARLFARVYVSDAPSEACQGLALPDDGFDHHASICFPHGRSGIDLPILLLQYTEYEDHLHAVLVHEILHCLIHYWWELQRPEGAELEPFCLLITNFVSEIFAQAQSVAMLGTPYLHTLAATGARPGSRQTAAGSQPRSVAETMPRDAFASAVGFLETYPWFCAQLGLGWRPSFDSNQLGKLWTPDQLSLAARLLPLATELFGSAILEETLYEKFLDAMGSQGPCGSLFEDCADMLYSCSYGPCVEPSTTCAACPAPSPGCRAGSVPGRTTHTDATSLR